jgi:hypothetical protein
MKPNRILVLTLMLAGAFALPSASFAAKVNKPAKGEGKAAGRPGKVLKDLDRNGDRQISGDEVDALKKQFAADPKGALARLDRNGDGKLDDDEIKALNARMARRAEGNGGEKKKAKNV